MKYLYWNGASDVMVGDKNKKTSKVLAWVPVQYVVGAQKQGDVRVIRYASKSFGVSEKVWQDFMAMHSDDARTLITNKQEALESFRFGLMQDCS